MISILEDNVPFGLDQVKDLVLGWVQDTAVTRKTEEANRTLSAVIEGTGTTAIHGVGKNSVEISAKHSMHRGVNMGEDKQEEVITIQIDIRGIETLRKSLVPKCDIAQDKTTVCITK